MQTFLPNIKFFATMRTLDDIDLLIQREHALTILRNLCGYSDAESNHPAVQMWEGFEYALGIYGMAACHEYRIERGFKCEIFPEIHEILNEDSEFESIVQEQKEFPRPPWLGDLNVHRSHRSHLIGMNPEHYADKWPNTPERMPILWPQLVASDPRGYRLRVLKRDIQKLIIGDLRLPPWLHYDGNKNEIISDE